MGFAGIGGGGIVGTIVSKITGMGRETGSSSSGQHFVGSALPLATYGEDAADGTINAGRYVGDGAVTSISGGGISGSNVASDVGHITGVTGTTRLPVGCHPGSLQPKCDGTYKLGGVSEVLMARHHHNTEPHGYHVTNLTTGKKKR
jgi:hypothetical protein